jgi:hypothetical protein
MYPDTFTPADFAHYGRPDIEEWWECRECHVELSEPGPGKDHAADCYHRLPELLCDVADLDVALTYLSLAAGSGRVVVRGGALAFEMDGEGPVGAVVAFDAGWVERMGEEGLAGVVAHRMVALGIA